MSACLRLLFSYRDLLFCVNNFAYPFHMMDEPCVTNNIFYRKITYVTRVLVYLHNIGNVLTNLSTLNTHNSK